MSGTSDNGKVYTDEQLTAFEKGWCDFMVDIWHERQLSLRIRDTGTLYGSIRGTASSGSDHVIEHRFAEYGIYVAAGVGKGYRHGNSGKDDDNGLQFLRGGKREYLKGNNASCRPVGLGLSRHAMLHFRHNERGAALTSGKHRQRRDWFQKKYFYSMMRLNEKEAAFYGEAYQGMMSTFLDELFSTDGRQRVTRSL